MTEWWTAQTGTYIGAFGGAALGVFAGLLGACAGMLAPRGRGRAFVLGSMAALASIGAVALIIGLIALIGGQPRHVYSPLCLLGGLLAVIIGPLLPVIRLRYAQAEQRRLDAADLRGA